MFTKQAFTTLVGALALTSAKTTTVEYPTEAEIEAAAATVLPYSPVSNVKGLAFDRFFQIWIENTVSHLWIDVRMVANLGSARTIKPLPTMRTSLNSRRRVSF